MLSAVSPVSLRKMTINGNCWRVPLCGNFAGSLARCEATIESSVLGRQSCCCELVFVTGATRESPTATIQTARMIQAVRLLATAWAIAENMRPSRRRHLAHSVAPAAALRLRAGGRRAPCRGVMAASRPAHDNEREGRIAVPGRDA